ncbi:unnamed protein product [Cochlearia groenlandica]
MSSSHFAIFCIILVSLFVLHECGDIGENIQPNLDLTPRPPPPCVIRRCPFTIFQRCYVCRGRIKFYTKNKHECYNECLRLNPPPSL